MIDYLHPILAHFVFPLLFVVLLFEVLSLFRVVKKSVDFSGIIFTLICFFSLASYYSGIYEFNFISESIGERQPLVENHQFLAKLYLISLVPTFTLGAIRIYSETKLICSAFILFLIVSVIIGGITAHRGGELVLKYGIGVNYLDK